MTEVECVTTAALPARVGNTLVASSLYRPREAAIPAKPVCVMPTSDMKTVALGSTPGVIPKVKPAEPVNKVKTSLWVACRHPS